MVTPFRTPPPNPGRTGHGPRPSDGAVILSQRGGDFDLTIGQDYSIGYLTSDATTVQLYIEESLAFHINTPEAAVHLTYR